MKYTLQERLNIGREIYDGKLTKYEASEQYSISIDCARDYMRLYRDANRLPPKNMNGVRVAVQLPKDLASWDLETLQAMTKEELIQEIIALQHTLAPFKRASK